MNLSLNVKKKRKLNGPSLDETAGPTAPTVAKAIRPQANGTVGAKPALTNDERIARDLLAGGTSSNSSPPAAIALAGGSASTLLSEHAATANMTDGEKYVRHMEACPEELDVESGAYREVTVENFGLSMLMGMGFKPEEPKKAGAKKKDEERGAARRPTRLGLGAKTMAGEGGVETAGKPKVAAAAAPVPATSAAAAAAAPALPPPPAPPLAPRKVEGTFFRADLVVRITKEGSHYNKKCKTVSFEDGYWRVRMEGGGEEVEVKVSRYKKCDDRMRVALPAGCRPFLTFLLLPLRSNPLSIPSPLSSSPPPFPVPQEKHLETVVKVSSHIIVLRTACGWKKGTVGLVSRKGKETCKVEGWEGEGRLDDVCMLGETRGT